MYGNKCFYDKKPDPEQICIRSQKNGTEVMKNNKRVLFSFSPLMNQLYRSSL
jgi:hypothetical protein